MAFLGNTAENVALARATRLGQKLYAGHTSGSGNGFSGGITNGVTSGAMGAAHTQWVEKLARNGRFTVTGFTTGTGMPWNMGVGVTTALTHPSGAAGISRGSAMDFGLTVGIVYKTGIASGVCAGARIDGTGASFGITGMINMSTGVVS